jgi:uncharacterized sulfatase
MVAKIYFPILFIVVATFLFSCNNAEDIKPNFIFILADDLGFSQLGCYGSSYYQTPHIDQLANEGIRFTNAYAAAAVCSPTRASIATGMYPARLHITNPLPTIIENKFPLSEPDWQKFLRLEEVTFAEILKREGYVTAHFGKWHLSIAKTPPESLPFNPDKQGFDETFVTYKPSNDLAKSWQDAENDAHNVDTITSLALDFIERNKTKPFFLYVSHNTIHDPLMEKTATIGKYERLQESEKPENHPVLAAMIERLDISCGKIFNKVRELGLEENTIIIFFSDNGGRQRYAAQTPFRAGKGWLYEGGIRVPLIVKWNGKVKPGDTSSALISSIDFFPTFLEMTGVKDVPENLDGKSFVSVLQNPDNEIHQNLFWHFPHYHRGSGMIPGGAVRSGNWKLIEWYEKSLRDEGDLAFELYNLENDVGEKVNLADSLPDMTRRLSGQLHKWRKITGAQMPVPNPLY